MNQITNVRVVSQAAHTKSPSARKLRGERAPLSALAAHQGGLVRAWLSSHVGLACVAGGWLFAFAGLVAAKPRGISAAICLLFCAVSLVAFGVGWIIRDERGDGNGAS